MTDWCATEGNGIPRDGGVRGLVLGDVDGAVEYGGPLLPSRPVACGLADRLERKPRSKAPPRSEGRSKIKVSVDDAYTRGNPLLPDPMRSTPLKIKYIPELFPQLKVVDTQEVTPWPPGRRQRETPDPAGDDLRE